MLFTVAQKAALQTIVAVWLAFAAGTSAIALSQTHDAALPPVTPGGTPPPDYTGSRITLTTYIDVPPPVGCGPIAHAATEADLRHYLGAFPDYNSTAPPYWGPYAYEDFAGGRTTAMAPSAPTPDHSTTNNQVAGVDELDSVQTDGWYLYAATGSGVNIVRAYPAEQMKVLSTIALGGYPYGLFLSGDRLIVVMQPSYPYYGPTGAPAMFARPMYYYNPGEVELRIYDVADRSDPQILYNYSVSGYFSGARMIGDFVYLVAGYSLYAVDGDLRLPTVSVNGVASEMSASSIGLPDGSFNTTLVTTIVSVNVTGGGAAKSFAFLAPASGQVYVSPHNLYLMGAAYEYSAGFTFVSTQTAISKFSLYKGDVTCYFGARVPGTVLNQFSADESYTDGHPYLRIATTVRSAMWTNASASVYVLNEKLERAGSLEGIAPGETIQATRFLGDRGYVVTFRRVDPLFVLDLKDPSHPSVVAELTLPGFSQYLQPIDENHLIGIGVDGTAAGATSGLKLSLFDVTDPAHPREVAGYAFGAYAYSEAQYDHHAVLYIASRALLVIPVQVYDYTAKVGGGNSFTGAYVFGVDLAAGFSLKAKIAQPALPSYTDPLSGTVYSYTPSIRRALYIGDFLYTVSDAAVQANAFAGFGYVSSVALPAPDANPIAYGGGVVPPSPGGGPSPL